MLFVLSGLVLLFHGGSVWRVLWFPICFLFFMIPVPLIAVNNISFKMKLFAASIATFLLNQMGLEAIREGSILRLRHATVIVDDVCSGLRSLISLMALGSIFAYWLKGPIVRKIVLFLATIPIAIITNVCRVVVLSSIGEIWGAQYATGFIHDATGFLVFALAFVMLYFVGRILE
jgi:exosortase